MRIDEIFLIAPPSAAEAAFGWLPGRSLAGYQISMPVVPRRPSTRYRLDKYRQVVGMRRLRGRLLLEGLDAFYEIAHAQVTLVQDLRRAA